MSDALVPLYPEPSVTERALDLLFPPLCVGCRRIGRWICAACWATTPWLFQFRCLRCGQDRANGPCEHEPGSSHPIDDLCVVATFEGTAREAVHALKYEGQHAISSLMGRLLAEVARPSGAELVTAIPLHRRRKRERGYDQAHMLARAAARNLNIPYAPGLLKRIRYTSQQATLDAERRHANVAGAFKPSRDLSGGHVLLVDDVFTTGATMREAARVLKEAGAARVTGAAFGRA